MAIAISVNDAQRAANAAAQPYSYNNNRGVAIAYSNALKEKNDMWNNPSKYGYDKYKNSWIDANGQKQAGVDELFAQVMNYGDFSYDMNKDALFQMYKQQYTTQGNRAMQNQMGIAAANSGGYNSSYAQTSAQDTFQTYMNDLSQKAVDTYQSAYSRWNDKYEQLKNRYSMVNTMNQQANEKYYTDLSNAQNRENSAYQAYNDDKNFDYQKYNDNRNYTQNQLAQAQDYRNWVDDFNQKERWNAENYNQKERWNAANYNLALKKYGK